MMPCAKHNKLETVHLQCAGKREGMELTLAPIWRSFCRPFQEIKKYIFHLGASFHKKDTVPAVIEITDPELY